MSAPSTTSTTRSIARSTLLACWESFAAVRIISIEVIPARRRAVEPGQIARQARSFLQSRSTDNEQIAERLRQAAGLLQAQDGILVVGTGNYRRMDMPDQTQRYLEAQGVAAPTDREGSQANRLQRQAARVVAALHLTC